MSLGHTIRLHYRVTHYIYRCTNSYTVLQQLILKFFLFSSIFLNFLQTSFYFVFPFLFLAIAKISLKRKKSFKVETLGEMSSFPRPCAGRAQPDFLVSLRKFEVIITTHYRHYTKFCMH